MESRIESSLPWRHRPFPELVRLAWPIAVSTLSYSAMTLVGTLFVGRLGASALAGVGLGGVAAFSVLCFGFGIMRGLKVLVSQAVGAGNRERAHAWLWTGITVAVGLGIAMTAIGFALAGELSRLAASEDAGRYAQHYLTVRMLGAPLVMLYVALREHRYGFGDTRSPMIASIAGNLVNVAADWLLIVHLDYGVAGAAWGTIAGHGVETALLVAVQWRDGMRWRPITLDDVRALFAIGLPTGLQFWLEVGSFALLTAIIARLGDQQLAAHQITLQVLHVAFLPTMALGEAGSVLAGQAVGAGAVRLVRRVARLALIGSVAYSGAAMIVLIVGGRWIAAGFTADASLRDVTVQLLFLSALFQIADGAAVVARGILRGAGDVRFPAVVGIVCAWVCTPPLAWFLGDRAGYGAAGGWLGLFFEITIASAIFWWRLERGGWLSWAKKSRARLKADRELVLAAA